jgi:hypothetical protein
MFFYSFTNGVSRPTKPFTLMASDPNLVSQSSASEKASRDLKAELAHELARAQLELNREWILGQMKQGARGQWMATGLATLCIGASVTVTLNGHDWVGGVLGGTTVVSLATVFIVGQTSRKTPFQKDAKVLSKVVKAPSQEARES